jgi:hypothetical protein
VRDNRDQPQDGGAGWMLVSQIRIGGARGCPAKTANRASVPSSAGGAAIAESGGVWAARAVSCGRMPIVAWTCEQQQGHGQKGQSPWGQGAGPSSAWEPARAP